VNTLSRGALSHRYTTKSDSWNPTLYNQFKKEREQPFRDLLALVQKRPNLSIIDLGCGTGETDLLILEAFPDSTILGIDSSTSMIESTKKLSNPPKLTFQLSDIQTFTNSHQTYDVIISNAALHWVPNHRELIPSLLRRVSPNGQFAAQVPTNHNQEFYVMIREVASLPKFAEPLKGWTLRWPILEIEEYAKILYDNGFTNIVTFEKIYPHVLENTNEIVNWIQGTGLQSYTSRLPVDLQSDFINAIKEKFSSRYPGSPVFFPFRRLFFYASKKQS